MKGHLTIFFLLVTVGFGSCFWEIGFANLDYFNYCTVTDILLYPGKGPNKRFILKWHHSYKIHIMATFRLNLDIVTIDLCLQIVYDY